MEESLVAKINHLANKAELKWREYLVATHTRIQTLRTNCEGLYEFPEQEYETYELLRKQAIEMTNSGQFIVLHIEFQEKFVAAVMALCNEVERRQLEVRRGLEQLQELILDPQRLEAAMRAALDQSVAAATERLSKLG